MAAAQARPLEILDLGAGNGWLCHRVARMGHKAVALDIRDDNVDGLGAAAEFLRNAPGLFDAYRRLVRRLPFESGRFDIALFNASLHYAHESGHACCTEAVRVTRPGGTIAILDSPFYVRDEDGAAMVAEKHAQRRRSASARAPMCCWRRTSSNI